MRHLEFYIRKWEALVKELFPDNSLQIWSLPIGKNTPYDGYYFGFRAILDLGESVEMEIRFSNCSRSHPTLGIALVLWRPDKGVATFRERKRPLTSPEFHRLDSWVERTLRTVVKDERGLHQVILGKLIPASITPGTKGDCHFDEPELWTKALEVSTQRAQEPIHLVSVSWMSPFFRQRILELVKNNPRKLGNWARATQELLSRPAANVEPNVASHSSSMVSFVDLQVLRQDPKDFYAENPECSGIFSLSRVGFAGDDECAVAVSRDCLCSDERESTWPHCNLLLFRRVENQWTIQRRIEFFDP